MGLEERIGALHMLRNGMTHRASEISPGRRTELIAGFRTNTGRYLGLIDKDPVTPRKMMQDISVELRTPTSQPSRPYIVSRFLTTTVYGDLVSVAETSLFKQSDSDTFILYNDASVGFDEAVNLVNAVEEEIVGRRNENFDSPLRTVEDRGVTYAASEAADMYLEMGRELEASARILKRDPSGIEVVRDYVRRLKINPNYFKGNLVHPFAEAGAQLGLLLYQKLYPFSEGQLK